MRHLIVAVLSPLWRWLDDAIGNADFEDIER